MIQTIRVRTNQENDSLGQSILSEIQNRLKIKEIKNIQTAKIYRLEGVNQEDAKILSEKLFCENINQIYSLNKPLLKKKDFIFEISYKPGVMNPQVASIIKAAEDLGIKLKAADSSMEYGISGKIKKEKLNVIIEKLNLFNKTVENIIEKEPQTLLIKGNTGKTFIIPIRKMNDKKLLELSEDKLFLNLEELKVIQNYFIAIKRDPTDIELETIAQTWSEHCAHKTFKADLIIDGKKKKPLISRIINEALKHKKEIVSAFVDNSGVMDFYDGMAICGKAETHNSPSAIEPYGGAMTGSGGVFRDVLGTGLGAKNIASTDIFCFAKPDLENNQLPEGCLPPKYLLKRVVAGVRDYGNRIGIPTNNGSVHFHNDFRAKPTVIVGAYGIMPKDKAQKGEPKIGDVVVAVGGKTGRDGIHGATFSSAEMTHKTINVNSSAVQIGNAIEEKRMFDALLEARDKNLIRAIQDCGAGGFSSAIGEMGEKLGVKINLEKVSLKYEGLSPWEIWVSESQERMAVAVPKNKLKKFLETCEKYNVESCVLGLFDGSKKLKIFFGKKQISDLEMNFLHKGLPQRVLEAKRNFQFPISNFQSSNKTPKNEKEWIETLKKVLSNENICSKEPIVRLYDHTVQGTNSLQTFTGEKLDGPNDATVIRPILNKNYGIIISHGLNPVLNNIDPYWGSIWAATEAVSNYTAVGGDYKKSSLINNYIWPFPDNDSLWSLDKSVDAVCDFMKALNLPVISGKDSLSSTYRGKNREIIKIPPVLCISVFGKIADVSKTVSSDFKKENSIIVLVGKQDTNAMAGSIYFSAMEQWNNGTMNIPRVNLNLLPNVLESIYQGIQKNRILSCHDISEGGLITAIFEMCVGGNMGSNVILSETKNLSSDFSLFNETAGTFIVEVENEKTAEKLFKNTPYKIIGRTIKENKIKVSKGNRELFNVSVDELKTVWQRPMKEIFS
ncbi:MAG: phosphoribosylformylglycinamidine synthase subunit PurL [Candidatus Levybacteria bacterium]|nr:phosphoribosylformylglycinamidine synthase subunit PurL [Candidatus Levybacteria bacterium]